MTDTDHISVSQSYADKIIAKYPAMWTIPALPSLHRIYITGRNSVWRPSPTPGHLQIFTFSLAPNLCGACIKFLGGGFFSSNAHLLDPSTRISRLTLLL